MIDHEPLDLGGRVPLVVAVTGHRHIRGEPREAGKSVRAIDEPALAASVREVLLQLLVDPDRRPRTTDAPPERPDTAPDTNTRRVTPVVVLNALAEGADRLVADVVRGLRSEFPEQLGDQLFQIFVSPCALEEYVAGFGGTRDRWQAADGPESFAQLEASACQHRYELPAMESPRPEQPDGVGAPVDPTLCTHTAEQERYRRLAAFLVRNAHVLLALTDRSARLREAGGRRVLGDAPAQQAELATGRPDRLEGLPPDDDGHDGGSTTVLSWFLRGLPPAYEAGALSMDRPPTRVAVELWEPEHPEPGALRHEDQVFTPGGRLVELLLEFEAFNRDVRASRDEQARQARLAPGSACAPCRAGESCEDGDGCGIRRPDLLAPEGLDALDEPERQRVRASLCRMGPLVDSFDAADTLVTDDLRPRRESAARRLVLGAGVALLLSQAFAQLHLAALLGAYVFTLAMLALTWALLVRDRLEEKRIVYRSLAESLRVQVSLRHAGVSLMVPNEFARHSLPDISWVRDALRGLFVCVAPRPSWNLDEELAAVERVRVAWIQGQGGTLGSERSSDPEQAGLGAGTLAVLGWFQLHVEHPRRAKTRLRDRYDARASRQGRSLSGELGWFEQKALLELEPAQRAWSMITRTGLGLGVGSAVLLLLVLVGDPGSAPGVWTQVLDLSGWTLALALASAPLLALAALSSMVSRVEAFEPLARHYREMARIFRRANEALEPGHAPLCRGVSGHVELARRRRVLADLAREALGDEVRWNQLSRSRPLEINAP